MALAGLLSALVCQKKDPATALKEQRVLVAGAGSAGLGVAAMLVQGMVMQGLTEVGSSSGGGGARGLCTHTRCRWWRRQWRAAVRGGGVGCACSLRPCLPPPPSTPLHSPLFLLAQEEARQRFFICDKDGLLTPSRPGFADLDPTARAFAEAGFCAPGMKEGMSLEEVRAWAGIAVDNRYFCTS